MTTLTGFRRGDLFSYTFTLGNGWVGSDFTGGVIFTLRQTIPPSTETDDTNAIASVSVAGGEIVFSGATGTITILPSATNSWPVGKLFWDLQGKVTATSATYTIDVGEIAIKPDITRA